MTLFYIPSIFGQVVTNASLRPFRPSDELLFDPFI
jgi:hypothetical protein